MSNIHYSHRNGMIPILLICAVTLCLFFSDAGYSQPATNKDDPGRNDNATGQLSTPIYTDFPDTELGRQLSDHINYLAGVGKDAEGKYQESLKQLRQRAPQAVKVLAETYPRIRADRYFRRWAIVETMREMNNNSALNPLYRIALSPISTEHWRDPERFSIDKEINIRVTAVEGMSDLAMQGNKEAEQLLLRLITNKELGIRRQAIRGYLGVGQDRDRRARLLRSRLPKSDYGLIKLESTDVKRVPHPDDVPDNLKPRYKQKDDDPPRAVLSTSSFRNADTLFKTVSFTEPDSRLNFTSSSPYDTCTWMPGNNNDSGDNFYGGFTCNQAYVDQFWDHFDFDKGDWDDGFGYEAPCDLARPLARTFNALYLLAYSAEDYATSTGDFSGNALRWGYPYSASKIDELDGRCGSGSPTSGARATTYTGLQDNRTVLKWPFFYGEVVIERAGTIVHEARHAGGKSHNGGSSCPRGKSCDSSWSYKGANMYQVLYLWWFYVDGTRTTTGMRNYARQEAQRVIDRGFVTNPGYVI